MGAAITPGHDMEVSGACPPWLEAAHMHSMAEHLGSLLGMYIKGLRACKQLLRDLCRACRLSPCHSLGHRCSCGCAHRACGQDHDPAGQPTALPGGNAGRPTYRHAQGTHPMLRRPHL